MFASLIKRIHKSSLFSLLKIFDQASNQILEKQVGMPSGTLVYLGI